MMEGVGFTGRDLQSYSSSGPWSVARLLNAAPFDCKKGELPAINSIAAALRAKTLADLPRKGLLALRGELTARNSPGRLAEGAKRRR